MERPVPSANRGALPYTHQVREGVIQWPISHRPEGFSYDMQFHGFLWPRDQSSDCEGCGRPFAIGDLCIGDNYHEDDWGYHLCEDCAAPLIAGAGLHPPRPDGLQRIDQLQVTVVAEHCSSDLADPSAILLGPHSDNGMPRARSVSPVVDVVLDAGHPVAIERVRVHNWYFGGFPRAVEVFVADRSEPSADWMLAGAGPLRKASVWVDVDCLQGTAHRFVRLRFGPTLEPGQYEHIVLGVVLLE